MPASKQKKKLDADRRARREKTRQQSQLNQQPLHQRDDRHTLIAMTLASLVAGLLMIVNLDRSTHATSLSKEERLVQTSRHGWPLVYLERDLMQKPQFFFRKRLYSWPWPAVKGEQRRWNWGNLAGDAGIAVAIVTAAFAMISFVVRKYDQWDKHPQT